MKTDVSRKGYTIEYRRKGNEMQGTAGVQHEAPYGDVDPIISFHRFFEDYLPENLTPRGLMDLYSNGQKVWWVCEIKEWVSQEEVNTLGPDFDGSWRDAIREVVIEVLQEKGLLGEVNG